jgi:hypothetical protein
MSKSPTLTLMATQFRDLVTSVLPHASRDATLPALCSLRIRTRGEYVTALATDRYRIGLQRVRLDAPAPGFDAVVSVAAIRRVLSTFKHTRRHDPALRFTLDGDLLTVAADDGLDGLSSASLTFSLSTDFPYPDVDRIIRSTLEATAPTELVTPTFNPHFLADFRIGQPRNVPIQITPSGEALKPWRIRVGRDFIGLLVPVKLSSGGPVDAGDASEWLALLDGPASPKADESATETKKRARGKKAAA